MLALTLHIELFTQSHYRESIREDADLSELYKDIFLFHWAGGGRGTGLEVPSAIAKAFVK